MSRALNKSGPRRSRVYQLLSSENAEGDEARSQEGRLRSKVCWVASVACHRMTEMINLNKFKYKRKKEGHKRRHRSSSSASDDPDCLAIDPAAEPIRKKTRNDFVSFESGSDDDEGNSQGSPCKDPLDNEDTPESLDSPLFMTRKKKTFFQSETSDQSQQLKNGDHKASNGLGLSSSDSEDDDNGAGTSRLVFPRLNCGITSNSPTHDSTPSTHKTEDKNCKELPQANNEIDENFVYDEDDFDSHSSEEEYFEFGRKKRSAVLNFFQTASLDEIITMESCSQKKADIIISLRPFKSWNDLTMKMSTTKSLSPDILFSCADLLKQRTILTRLLDQCRAISTVLTNAIEKLHCSDNMTNGITTVKTPSNVPSHLRLKPYQVVGLNWMVLLHRHKVNGVLADEMGLGKTIQTICFLAHLHEQDPNTGPHLIVVPSSTLGNWQREFSVWCPSLDVLLYQGSQAHRRAMRVGFLRGRTFDIVLTTYNSAISTPEDRSFLRKIDAEYAVFDEGHMLKNMSSQRYISLMKIKAKRKLLLTGTPLQNNLMELMSLLRFVMPHMFEQTTESLVRIFKHSNSESKSKYAMRRIGDAKNIMQPFVLRRLKKTVLKQLPSKSTETVLCEMTPSQKAIYDKTKEKFKLGLHKQSSLEMKNAFTELRKAANHPLLRRDHYQTSKLVQMAKILKKYESAYHDSVEKLIVEDMTVMTDFEIHQFCLTIPSIQKFALDRTCVLNSGKFKMLDTLLPDIKAQDDKVVIFSQWTMIIDILEKYLHQRDYRFLRLDGSTPVNIRINLIDEFESDPDITVFLLSTKAGGLGINLTAANHVILHDIDLNPHNDKQAEDRCHRLGQTKDVKIIRLVSKDSIEEGMLQLAANKLQLEQQLSAEKDDFADIATLIQNTLSR